MRIHVALPKPTTVSVDDDLVALLGAALVLDSPALHADAKAQLARARFFIRGIAAQCGAHDADGLSRKVQRAIFRRVANPLAVGVLDARDTEEAKTKAAAARLEEGARNGWPSPAQIAEKRHIDKLRAEGAARTRAARKGG